MLKRLKQKKNILIMIIAILLVAAISVGATLAWLTATSDDESLDFKVGEIDVELTDSLRTYFDSETLYPGRTALYSATDTLKVTCGVPVYVRIKLTYVDGGFNNRHGVQITTDQVMQQLFGKDAKVTNPWTIDVDTANNTIYFHCEAPIHTYSDTSTDVWFQLGLTPDGDWFYNEEMEHLDGIPITLTAEAVQDVDGTFTNAWTAFES